MDVPFFIFMGWMVAVMASVTVSFDMARKRGRDAEGWALLAGMFGPLAVLALRWLGQAPPSTREQRRNHHRISGLVSGALLIGLALLLLVPLLRACFRI